MKKQSYVTLAIAVIALILQGCEGEKPADTDISSTTKDAQYEPEPIQEETGKEVEEHDHSSEIQAKGEEEAFEIDSQFIAKKFGWNIKETRQHMRNQDKFGMLVSKIYKKSPDVFAGSAMARNPGEEATVWIKGEALPYVKEMAEKFMQKNKLKVRMEDGMRYSELDQEKRMDQIAEVLEKKGFEGVGAVMLPGDIILFSLPASDKFPETPTPKSLAEQRFDRDYIDSVAKQLLPDDMDKRGVYLTFTFQPIDVDEHARGGRQVYGNGFQCTSGFSVVQISDERNGIATAAHCTGMSNFNAESPEADFDLFHRGEHCGSHGDVEWKSSNHFELAEYWASPSDRRDVNSSETWYSVNNVYCVYSRMQGTRSCDRVYSTSVNQTGSSGACNGVQAKRLVAMDNDNTVGGDSGGPWSYSTKAAGIHKGDKWIWFGTRNTFTKASRLDEALGVRIRTK